MSCLEETTTTTVSTTQHDKQKRVVSFANAMVAGGLAGTSVDVALFPIDTIKTRLQSPQGFLKAGGFRGMYRGLGAAAAGSAPGAALFFSTYETLKPKILSLQQTHFGNDNESISHMLAASIGEAMACLVRVPTEVVKAKMQTGAEGTTLSSTVRMVLQETHGSALSGVTGGFYRGYGITLMREIPFAMIQFPMYEQLKKMTSRHYHQEEATPLQAAACGSFSGGIAAGLTTPLDVIKTRLMLGADKHGRPYHNALDVARRVISQEGTVTLFSGIQPRVMWISIGGFVFFGAYEGFRSILTPIL